MLVSPLSIALICGTRPEAIKLAPVFFALQRRPQVFQPQLWLTGQHRQMLDQVMRVFGLRADRDLNLMTPGQTLVDVTTGVLRGMDALLAEAPPACILVQGDTTTVMAAALAAFYRRIPVGHVEAGLRTGNRHAPFPEEMNRQLATRLADFHFAPTPEARDNLLREGVPAARVWVTGNTVIDALDLVVRRVRARRPELPEDFPTTLLEGQPRMVLITGHRRENFGAGFEAICRAIARLTERFADVAFLYPVHLNPNVREPVGRLLGGRNNLLLIEPLDYEAFVWAMDRSTLILTDSGGVQEEGPHLGKPVLVMRDTTERPEGVAAGTARLVGTDEEKIVAEVTRLLTDDQAYAAMARAQNPYGDGHAAERIADVLERELIPDAPQPAG